VWPKDQKRIEEERAGVARPAPATLASSHLAQALDAFDDACSPEAVFAPRKIWPLQSSDSVRSRRTLSEITQRNLALTATLFTAFAAEAFVNNFLDVHDLKSCVSATKFKKLDRGSTVRKYVEQAKLAGGMRLTVDELRAARLGLAAEVGPWDKFTELLLRDPHAECDEAPGSA
jgi:hypothetical protein